MSSAPSKTPHSAESAAEPAFDLDYSIEDFEVLPFRDSHFLFRRIEQSMVQEGSTSDGRTLDVACGVGRLAAQFERGWGLEPSAEMLGLSRLVVPDSQAVLVRGVAETQPFRDGSFDRVICQGALDHFVGPRAFMREAARIVGPNGRVIIALANYESLSCRLGRLLARVLRRPKPDERPYWQPPPDHQHKGELPFVRGLGGSWLQLERCYGISLLWLLPGWGRSLEHLPSWLTNPVLSALDAVARRAPALADTIVSVWRPATGGEQP